MALLIATMTILSLSFESRIQLMMAHAYSQQSLSAAIFETLTSILLITSFHDPSDYNAQAQATHIPLAPLYTMMLFNFVHTQSLICATLNNKARTKQYSSSLVAYPIAALKSTSMASANKRLHAVPLKLQLLLTTFKFQSNSCAKLLIIHHRSY